MKISTSAIEPIHSLPAEILLQIFYIVLGDDRRQLVDSINVAQKTSLSFPRHPETLSHVCSRWRQIAIAANGLWTGIDLVLHHPLGPGFLARAKTYVDRAGQLPLDVHMIDPTPGRSDDAQQGEFHEFVDFDFLAFTKSPINSLSVVSYYGFRIEHLNFLRYCITKCAPQTLRQLVLQSTNFWGQAYFIESVHNPHDSQSLRIDISEELLENIWGSTAVLRLVGLYPYWTSQAYHRLVDLRLGSKEFDLVNLLISEAQLIDILKASPELRIFHLHTHPTPLPPNVPDPVVRLNELESINLTTNLANPSRILRFIIPGQKPLRLSVCSRPAPLVEQFFRRSNVTRLYMSDCGSYPPMAAIHLCPNLRVLVLEGSSWDIIGPNFETIPQESDGGAIAAPINIEALFISYGHGLTLIDLKRIVAELSVRELTLWNTYPDVGDGHSSDSRVAFESEVTSLCPVVNYLGGSDKNPLDEWDLF